ncbi:protein kinase family protein [Kribbella sp. NPDC056861]|uniref:protein kinase family protein n=1 Tax=Kribbella sp. NPDC056861 TaxID=3154857 RepID=UPI003435928E
MEHEDLSGYSLRRGLGSGTAGTVWLLRDLATGRHAVLKRIPKSTVPAPKGFLGDLELARTIDHPHLARLYEVRESDREWLLFSQYVAAGTLTSLLERRGVLSPGELVTLLSPLAQALSLLHGTGLPHGRLTSDNIMFDADGRPVITDAGLRSLVPSATPESDLQSLSEIAQAAGSTAKTFPPAVFSTADQLARHALQQALPLPIDLGFTPDQQPTSTPYSVPTQAPSQRLVRPTHRKPPIAKAAIRRAAARRSGRPTAGQIRRFLHTKRAAYGILAACGAGAVTTLAIGIATLGVLGDPANTSTAAADQTTHPTPTPTPQPTPTPSRMPSAAKDQQWLQILQALDSSRSRAFARLDPGELNAVYVSGSPPWTADRKLIATYRSQRLRIEDLRLEIKTVKIEAANPKTVVLRIVDRLVAGAAVSSSGQRTAFPPGTPTSRRITLTANGPGWRISAIAAA